MEVVRYIVGVILVLVGLYLVATGAPAVTRREGVGPLGIIGDIFKEYPRVAIGLLLVLIGGLLLGADIPEDWFS
jgi:hypothetical protein